MGLFKDLGLDLTIAKPSVSYEEAMSILYAATVALEKDKANAYLIAEVLSFAKLIFKFV